MYIKVRCQADVIKLSNGITFKRNQIGIFIVSIDMLCVFVFLLYLQFMYQLIHIDIKRHRNLLIETQDFALEFTNLPKL